MQSVEEAGQVNCYIITLLTREIKGILIRPSRGNGLLCDLESELRNGREPEKKFRDFVEMKTKQETTMECMYQTKKPTYPLATERLASTSCSAASLSSCSSVNL